MSINDVLDRSDISDIVERFYANTLKDPIVGFLFTDVAKIDLDHHLPIIVNFWSDIVLSENSYHGNPLSKHQEIHTKVPLRAGHFTRWLYLFNKAVDEKHQGENAQLMKNRAEIVAKSIAASLTKSKRGGLELVLKGSISE